MNFLVILVAVTLCGTSSGQNQNQNQNQKAPVLSSNATVEKDLEGVLRDAGSRTNRGNILFFFPVITKSAKITFMPVAEKLAERGHQVLI
jgi:hypothetical protein